MGKHLDKLKTGDPHRKVSDQEFLNVMGEMLEENIEILRQANRRVDAILNKPQTPKLSWWGRIKASMRTPRLSKTSSSEAEAAQKGEENARIT